MLKMLQIIRYLKAQGLSLDQIMSELTEIVDNGRSDYFELSDADVIRITDVFHNDELFDSAMKVGLNL